MAAAGPAKHVHPDDYSPPLFVLSEAEVAQLSIALIPATGTQAMFFCCLPDTGEYASMLFDAAGRLNVVKRPNYGRTP